MGFLSSNRPKNGSSEERTVIREEGKKLEAESQEGEKLASAKIEGDVNEAKEGGKVVATEVTSDGLSNRK